jgi:hypothetical protein
LGIKYFLYYSIIIMPKTRGHNAKKKKNRREMALRLVGTAAAGRGGGAVRGSPMVAMGLATAYPNLRREIEEVGNMYSSQASGSAAARNSAAAVRSATARYNNTLHNRLNIMKRFIFNKFRNTKVWRNPANAAVTTLSSEYPPFTSNGNFRGEWLQETLHKSANALNNRNKVDLINRLGYMVNDDNHTNEVRAILANLPILEAGGPVRNVGSGHPRNRRRLTLLQAASRPTPSSVSHSGQIGGKRTFGGQGPTRR